MSPASGRRRESLPTLLAPASVLSVGQLTLQIQQLLEGTPALQQVRVQGEIGPDYRGPASSGHHYFALKDAEAQINCVMWSSTARNLRIGSFSAGDQVILTGDLRVYAPRGAYQLSVTNFERAGQGAAWLQFLELKARLEAEGLFAAERKVALPEFPRCIGIVTSAEAAALRDILNILRSRAPHLPVKIAPTLVQGPLAAPMILKALFALAQDPEVDVIILARGGGSFEDLACFNDESLVRALATIETPIITGVGHETDFTLVDFVADRRAPTPTAAAAMAAPDGPALRHEATAWLADAEVALLRRCAQHRAEIEFLLARPALARPGRELEDRRQDVDDWLQRCTQQMRRRWDHRRDMLWHLAERQVLTSPGSHWRSRGIATAQLYARCERTMVHRVERTGAALARIGGILQETHPDRLLARGFALVRNTAGQLVTRLAEAPEGAQLTLRLRDGTVPVDVTGPGTPTAIGEDS